MCRQLKLWDEKEMVRDFNYWALPFPCGQIFLLVTNTNVDGINKWKLNQSPGVYNKTLSWT
jgi:hypothetical protein